MRSLPQVVGGADQTGLFELLGRVFYPMPFTAAASTSLPTPWYLDYGHLAF
jgi:hypothetical protein